MKNYKWLVIFIIFICLLAAFFLKISNVDLVKDFTKEDVTENLDNNSVTDDNRPQVSVSGHDFLTELAIDAAVQKKGLSGRDSLDQNQSMLFVFPAKSILSFWMIDMKFNIDLLWINDDKVVGIERNMLAPAPGTEDKDLLIYRSPEPANRVLEINSGLVDLYGIKIGDQLDYKNINF